MLYTHSWTMKKLDKATTEQALDTCLDWLEHRKLLESQ